MAFRYTNLSPKKILSPAKQASLSERGLSLVEKNDLEAGLEAGTLHTTVSSCFCYSSAWSLSRSLALQGPQFSWWQNKGIRLDQWFSTTSGVRKGYFSITQLFNTLHTIL